MLVIGTLRPEWKLAITPWMRAAPLMLSFTIQRAMILRLAGVMLAASSRGTRSISFRTLKVRDESQ